MPYLEHLQLRKTMIRETDVAKIENLKNLK